MVKGNDKINRNYWTYPYMVYVFWTHICVCLKLSVIYIYYCNTYFLLKKILQALIKICLFSLGWHLKLGTLLRSLVYTFLSTCFYIFWVCWIKTEMLRKDRPLRNPTPSFLTVWRYPHISGQNISSSLFFYHLISLLGVTPAGIIIPFLMECSLYNVYTSL